MCLFLLHSGGWEKVLTPWTGRGNKETTSLDLELASQSSWPPSPPGENHSALARPGESRVRRPPTAVETVADFQQLWGLQARAGRGGCIDSAARELRG